MKIKKIRARNFSSALAAVRRELGEDAVILSSEDMKGIKPYVEVTAAIDYDLGRKSDSFQTESMSDKNSGDVYNPVEENADYNDRSLPNELAELKSEIVGLRQSIDSMKERGFELNLPKDRKDIYRFLKGKSIRDEFAQSIAEKVNGVEDISKAMTADMRSSHNLDNDKRVKMLIGPTGVGKTTTIAKLATKAIREGKRVAMISYDSFKIGAAEQIRIYSRMIGIPLEIISDMEDLKKSIQKHSDRDLLLLDTTGQNPRNDDYIRGLAQIGNSGLPIETQLLLSTSSDSEFLIDMHKYYRSLPIDTLAFTKTDEAVRLGSIYNLCRVYQKPVGYITTGQSVPGNIEFPDSDKLTNLILRTGSA